MVANPVRPGSGATARHAVAALLTVVLCAWLGAAVPLGAQPQTTIDLAFYNTVAVQDSSSVATGLGTAEIQFSDNRSRFARPLVQLKTTLYELDGVATAAVSVPRAEVKWRVPIGEAYTARFTAGRSRLSWGNGTVFNAGDVINGVRPSSLDLTASVLRDETVWLLGGYFPLSTYSFFEPVLFVPGLALSTQESTAQVQPVGADQTSGGFRLQWKTGQIKSEIGYIYRGPDQTHTPYVAAQGNLLVDLYVAASTTAPTNDLANGDSNGTVSVGAYHIASGRRNGSWTFRAEGLFAANSDPAIFPEITWSPSQLLTAFVRSTVTFDGESSASALGLTWSPTTGLDLSLIGTVNTGTDGAGGIGVAGVENSLDLESEPVYSATALVRYSF